MDNYFKASDILDKAIGTDAYFPIKSILLGTKTADVAPVRYGRWVPADQFGDCCYTCSECGFERDAYLLDVGNYCPNCGAKMDGKEGKHETD